MGKRQRNFRIEGSISERLDSHCSRHGDATYHVENALLAYLDGLEKPKKAKSKAVKKAEPADTELQALCKQVWGSYSQAYFSRYGTEPVRNVKVNSSVKQLAQRLGQDAVGVAGFYVSINDQWLVKCMHDIGNLIKNCETYRTQWATGQTVTNTQARQVDQSQSNYDAVQQALQMME